MVEHAIFSVNLKDVHIIFSPPFLKTRLPSITPFIKVLIYKRTNVTWIFPYPVGIIQTGYLLTLLYFLDICNDVATFGCNQIF